MTQPENATTIAGLLAEIAELQAERDEAQQRVAELLTDLTAMDAEVTEQRANLRELSLIRGAAKLSVLSGDGAVNEIEFGEERI